MLDVVSTCTILHGALLQCALVTVHACNGSHEMIQPTTSQPVNAAAMCWAVLLLC